MDATFWQKLLEVGIFAIFVQSIIEVVKGISAVGILGVGKQLILTLWNNKTIEDTHTVQCLNFAIALTVCFAFDYGIMASLLKLEIAGKFAQWVDYFGTASLVYQGAGVIYDKFSALKTQWQKAQDTAKSAV